MFLGVTFFRNCVKMYTLDSGIDVAHGINVSHGIFGKNIKYWSLAKKDHIFLEFDICSILVWSM